jgi:hypothetical protein
MHVEAYTSRTVGPSVLWVTACTLPAGLAAVVLLVGRESLSWFADWPGPAALAAWAGLTVGGVFLLRRFGREEAARTLGWGMVQPILFCSPWLLAGLPTPAWPIPVGGGLIGLYAGLVLLATRPARPRRGLSRSLLPAGAVGGISVALGCAWAFARDGAGSAGGWLGVWLAAWLMARSASFAAQLNKRPGDLSRHLARHHLLRGVLLIQGGILTALARDSLLAACCFGSAFVLFSLSGLLDRSWQRDLLAELS